MARNPTRINKGREISKQPLGIGEQKSGGKPKAAEKHYRGSEGYRIQYCGREKIYEWGFSIGWSTRLESCSFVVVRSSEFGPSSMSAPALNIMDGSSIISLPSTRNPPFSTRKSFEGVPGREDANPDEVAVAVEINC